MTVETKVANLTTAVDNLAEAVNVKKATLDASVADAESARDAAAASATTASGHATSAAASAAAAASTASGIAGFDLDAIAASKAVTAVDVFVYDTSKDSDGGAWRKRTQHTSWYNETLNTATRGSRREFPAVAVIVAESNKVTIYDGDDPALPMWMVFNQTSSPDGNLNWWRLGRTATSVAMTNGVFVLGQDGTSVAGIGLAYFASDALVGIKTGTGSLVGLNVSQRNLSVDMVQTSDGRALVSNDTNDVAMTVLPDAPIDPATGLPVPTIAVATAGGVSVIKDDGTVVDSATTLEIKSIDIDSDILFFTRVAGASSGVPFFTPLPILSDGFAASNYRSTTPSGNIPTLLGYPDKVAIGANQSHLYAGSISGSSYMGGVTHLAHQPDDYLKSMVAYTTSTYNTGWMNGDIKGAFLADTDDTDLVGSGELVTNGTFDTDTSGWTGARSNETLSLSANTLRVTADASGAFGASTSITGLTVGKTYVAQLDCVTDSVSGSVLFRVDDGSDLNVVGSRSVSLTTGESGTITFTALATTEYVGAIGVASAAAEFFEIDNISVRLADADRSVNNNVLIVNGTVTRSPVATGAELVAYSGFSASNYLEQPYNSALDFGTGDFCVMGWIKTTDADGYILERGDVTRSGPYFYLYHNASVIQFSTSPGGSFDTGNVNIANNQWRQFCAVRASGVASLYVDGALKNSAANTGNLTNSNAILRMAHRITDGASAQSGSLALLRISATAPTAEQIKKIYEDEKVLFQENAACTLYGTSDAVTALAHDSDTGLLHVGTSAGRSVFQGLRRVSNTTTAVGTAISAANGLVAEE